MKRYVVALAVLAFVLVGCGSGGDSSGETTAASIAPATAARQKREANAICTQMVAEAHRLGRKALSTDASAYESSIEFTTEALIAPAVPVVARSSRELREIAGAGADPQLAAYVAMFDPILSLIEERVRAGRRGDAAEAHEIELQLSELAQIQQTLAKEAGLRACQTSLIASFAEAKG